MSKLIPTVVLTLLLTVVVPVKADMTYIPRPLSDYSVHELITHFAHKYNVSQDEMEFIIRCESGYNSTAVGDHGKSYGLAQIYLPAHPSISPDQATDPVFAVEFLARNLSQGHGTMWTCWKMMNS